MKTYHVFVTRVSYSRPLTIEVEADDERLLVNLHWTTLETVSFQKKSVSTSCKQWRN